MAALQYGESAGEPHLLDVLREQRHDSANQVVVTSGSQQALSLCLAALEPDDSAAPPLAAMEDPGYLGALQLLHVHRYGLEPIPVDSHGMRVDVLADRLAAGLRITVCYVNPTFQNPTGATLSQQRGSALLDLAERYGFVVIADDPYRQLYFGATAPPDAFRPSPNLVRLGSLSKTLAPGLRLGWLEAQADIVTRVERAKQATDLHTNTPAQLVAAKLLGDASWWEAHLDGLRAGYRQRRASMLDAVAHRLRGVSVEPSDGGFFCWVQLPSRPNDQGPPVAADVLARSLDPTSKSPVGFVPGSAFAVNKGHDDFVRLSYSNANPDLFDEGINRLSRFL